MDNKVVVYSYIENKTFLGWESFRIKIIKKNTGFNQRHRNKLCRTQLEHIEKLKNLIQRQMLKQYRVQKQMAWARSLLTASILITGTADVSNESKPFWLLYNS